MTHNKYTQSIAHTKQNEPFFVIGVIFVKELQREFVVERRLRFLKRDAMLLQIRARLSGTPVESKHTYIVITERRLSMHANASKKGAR